MRGAEAVSQVLKHQIKKKDPATKGLNQTIAIIPEIQSHEC